VTLAGWPSGPRAGQADYQGGPDAGKVTGDVRSRGSSGVVLDRSRRQPRRWCPQWEHHEHRRSRHGLEGACDELVQAPLLQGPLSPDGFELRGAEIHERRPPYRGGAFRGQAPLRRTRRPAKKKMISSRRLCGGFVGHLGGLLFGHGTLDSLHHADRSANDRRTRPAPHGLRRPM